MTEEQPGQPRTPGTATMAVPPGERGATRIADRVVAKIATQAAREALAGLPRTRYRRTPRSWSTTTGPASA